MKVIESLGCFIMIAASACWLDTKSLGTFIEQADTVNHTKYPLYTISDINESTIT